jgi:protein gp37
MSTTIEWTDETWNPVSGCEKISPGCKLCYAETNAIRFWPKTQAWIMKTEAELLARPSAVLDRPRRFTDVQCNPTRLAQPLRWRKPRKVFVNSMSDLFHEDVPDSFIYQVLAVMALAPHHTFQVLTKRPERQYQILSDPSTYERVVAAMDMPDRLPRGRRFPRVPEAWPLPHVWLGISAENQAFLDLRLPLLLETPAVQRFVSAEPLLGGMDIAKHRPGANRLWVIVGGESGANARPCHVTWIRSIVRQCQESDTPVFVKQLGAVPLVPAERLQHWEWGGEIRSDREAKFEDHQTSVVGVRTWRVVLDSRKGGDMSEWPEDLRVREFPAVPDRGAL